MHAALGALDELGLGYLEIGRSVGGLSGGEAQRVKLAAELLRRKRSDTLYLLDEPTAGLDPWERIRFRNLLVELSKERIVIFSTHIIEDISSSCNNVAVLNKGDLCYVGTPAEMAQTATGAECF